jgi:hypothetical protein
LAIAEDAYRNRLWEALATCRAGYWGLFGVNDAVDAAFPRRRSLDAEELLALGESVERLRERLGSVEAFALYRRFLSYRRTSKDPNSPGAPRLARMFIEELELGEVTQ